MQKFVSTKISAKQSQPFADVKILSVATAVPSYQVSQQEISERARRVFPDLAHLDGLYANTGIETRYNCMPLAWYQQNRTWEEKTKAFRDNALELLEKVATEAVADIDCLVVNTVTGLAVPGLDALLMNRLAFRSDTERLPIFGFGCAAGVAGLSRAAALARARPTSHILFLTVDLCSLCLRVADQSPVMFVATALFGDGAAGVVLSAKSDGPNASVSATGEHLWRSTEDIMGWAVKDDGFGVILSAKLPVFLQTHLKSAIEKFLADHGLTLEEFEGFLFHPGGRRVLIGLESIFQMPPDTLKHSWSVLRDYGNMSSATILFILQRAMCAGVKGRHLLVAFGPGFSAYFAVVDL